MSMLTVKTLETFTANMLRNAQVSDLPALMALGKRLHAKSPYPNVPIDVLTCGATLGQCINSSFGFAVVAVHDGKITGMMLGAAMPLWFSKRRSATDFIVYAETPGDGYRMIRRFVDWANSIPNVVEITLAQSSGIDVERTAQIYERVGLQRVGNLYTTVKQTAATEQAA